MRASGVDVILNLTAGMGGDYVPDATEPWRGGAGTDMASVDDRLVHVEELRPEICTLDCGSMNYAMSAYVSTPDMLRAMAARIKAAGVKPEMEVFELGHVWQAKMLVEEGLIEAPPLFQLCMGIPYGAEADPRAVLAMRDLLPPGAVFAAFAIGRMQMPMVAQAVLMGGHVRVGLEDNLWLDKGVYASNGDLVTRACEIVRLHGRARARPGRGAREARAGGALMDVRKVALVGGGVIGAGWAARLVENGIDVVMCDPDPEVERKVGEVLANADRAYAKLTMAPRGRRGRSTFTRDVEAAVARRRLRPGERARARGAEDPAVRADRPGDAARRDHRVQHLGPAADPAAVRDGASRAVHGRAPVQPGLSPAAGRDLRRRADQCGDQAARRRLLRAHRHAALACPQGDRRLHRRPADGGDVARVAAPDRRGRGDRRGAGRRDPLRRRPALVVHGQFPDLPHRRRRAGHAPFHGPVRPGAEAALDQAGSARADRRAARQDRGPVRRAGGQPLDPRAGAPARRLPDLGHAGAAGAGLGCGAGPQALRRQALRYELRPARHRLARPDAAARSSTAPGSRPTGSTTTAT